MAAQPTLINSVVRALHLLDAVGSAGGPVTAKHLARTTDLPLATAYHLLRTMVHEGYLQRTPDGYVLGEHATALAERSPVGRHRSRQVLNQLHETAGAASYLAVLRDGEVHLSDIVDSPAHQRVDLWVGLHDAAHATAVGKAILAALPEPARRAYLATHPLQDLTPRTQTDPRALLRELGRQRELAVDREEYAVGVVCLAVPVPAPGATAAVAVSLPRERAALPRERAALPRERATVGPGPVAALRRAARLLALAGQD